MFICETFRIFAESNNTFYLLSIMQLTTNGLFLLTKILAAAIPFHFYWLNELMRCCLTTGNAQPLLCFRVRRFLKVKQYLIMKKIIKETSQVEVTKSANVTPEKLATVIQQTLNSLPGTKKKKVPIVITKGDNWLCVASVVGDKAVTLSITDLKK